MEENKDIWQVNFSNFINSLGLECLVSLGKIENPLSKTKEVNQKQSRYIIDTLDMIKEKTKGNLNADEEKLLEDLSAYLKMLFLEETKNKNKGEKDDKPGTT